MQIVITAPCMRHHSLGELRRGREVEVPDSMARRWLARGFAQRAEAHNRNAAPFTGRWHTVVCLASGPSLTQADVDLVRAWRMAADANTVRGVIVANTTYRIAPWADALFAMDKQWWDQHRVEVQQVFTGERFTSNPVAPQYGIKRLTPEKAKAYGNSGAACIALAIARGARRVVMLGYDCQHTGGQTHWHGSHPKGLGDAGSIGRWPAKFRQLAAELKPRAEILNASRETALDMFERKSLEECLALP